jgi:type IV pilus assembly protein PilW
MYGTAANVLDDNPTAVNSNVKVDRCIGLKQDDLVMVANCSRSTIMRLTNNPENGGCPPAGGFNTATDANNNNNANFRLNPPYLVTSRAILFKFGAYAYFIGRNPANRPSLYRTNMDGAAAVTTEEVVENIENMDLLFGEDTDGDGFADVYRIASQVASWGNVVSVRVTLVAVSPDAGASQQRQNYYFGASNSGTAVNWQTATDSRLRQVFVSTVAIRNKLP